MKLVKSILSRLNTTPLLVIFLLSCAVTSWAGVVYVDAGAGGDNDGSSWMHAYTDLQDALASAEWGDEIWVAEGTYKPTSDTDRSISFVMIAGVAIYGGFAGSETELTQRDWEVKETILSGDIGVVEDKEDNSYHVVVGGHMARLDGFTITKGNSKWAGDSSVTGGRGGGGGMYNLTISLSVENCLFINNSADWGGGMYNRNCSLTVVNCSFKENSAEDVGGGMCNKNEGYPNDDLTTLSNCNFYKNDVRGWGGGMYNSLNTLSLDKCTFNENSAGSDGGGMCNYNSSSHVFNCTFNCNSASSGGGMANSSDLLSPTVENCIFRDNSAIGYNAFGGGMINDYCSARVENCIFLGNSAIGTNAYGGGIYNGAGKNTDGSSAIIRSCTFGHNNVSGENSSGGGIYNDGGAPMITNSILWHNNSSIGLDEIHSNSSRSILTHNSIRSSGGSGDLWDTTLGTDGGGNLMDDPIFVDLEDPAGLDGIWMTEDDGLALSKSSPCIDAGDSASAPDTDILGNPRARTVDMGAYEYQGINPKNGIISWVFYH